MATNASGIPLQSHRPGKRGEPIDYLAALFLAAMLWFIPVGSESSTRNALGTVFISIVFEAIPFMFIGAIVGGLVEAFVSRERLTSWLPRRRWLTLCLAAAAGILFPVCECAVVPVVRRLVGKGLPISAAIGYLLGGPIVNPIVAASTALAYSLDWRMVALRMVLGYGIAVFVGFLMGRFFDEKSAIRPDIVAGHHMLPGCGCAHDHGADPGCEVSVIGPLHQPAVQQGARRSPHYPASWVDVWVDKVGAAFQHAADDFLAVGHYLVIGAFIAALAQTYIGRSEFLKLAAVPAVSVVLMTALAILLNLCSEADAFIAASFQGLMPLPAQMAFLLAGPMFDLKLLLMYQTLFRRKAIVLLAVFILTAVLAVSFGLEGVMKVWP